jgi:TetR/AcrR family transcriptional repressor of nem operon
MNKKQEVLDCALSRLRKYGYNGCSFREIATELDIKHTSIHYYFPTKDTLVKEVIENYSTDFFKNLDHSSLDDYFQIFLEVAEKNELCLCSVLTHDK